MNQINVSMITIQTILKAANPKAFICLYEKIEAVVIKNMWFIFDNLPVIFIMIDNNNTIKSITLWVIRIAS